MIHLETGEELREIEGFSNYSVTSFGRVFSAPNHMHRDHLQLSPNMTTPGYLSVSLWMNGRKFPRQIHVLVAQAFIPNPEGKPTVNHIKEKDKINNRVDNLEWATHKEQTRHAIKTGAFPLTSDPHVYFDNRRNCQKNPYFVQFHTSSGGEKREYIGHFPTREEARAARDRFVQNGRT